MSEPAGRSGIWIHRLLIVATLWLALYGFMVAGGMGPRPALLAGAIAVGAAGCWLVADLGRIATSADWRTDGRTTVRGGEDRRADRLRRSIERTATSVDGYYEVTPALVELLVEQVREEHGVDRQTDPRRFADIVGPELDDFVGAAGTAPRRYRPKAIAAIVERIEQL